MYVIFVWLYFLLFSYFFTFFFLTFISRYLKSLSSSGLHTQSQKHIFISTVQTKFQRSLYSHSVKAQRDEIMLQGPYASIDIWAGIVLFDAREAYVKQT